MKCGIFTFDNALIKSIVVKSSFNPYSREFKMIIHRITY